ncbi:hypothetical protein PHYSODRAFT_261763 [Phytophthora sojae]|uniref:Uncharacterized protein n=1 Tax=Phytophthora sojae (strain P6497) TaxID=1094619 RepID=G5A0J1_PHYSP|nr:hypothetical protein PHYSODRAFT_261763 [Phytophthora sojae]EGZ10527.1 hypothetical protein PHYSODRAFT_261763 [Phytophthora sojae]|eukprot:XP_009533272.1 hypothetical protein PHYSODRAFT_261763 [Phytophthora sojae]
MALLYGKSPSLPDKDPTITIKSEQPKTEAKLADDERSAESGDQYVTVACVSDDHTDLDAIPLNSPLVMVSSTGSTLNMSSTGSCFVELGYNEEDEGLVTIRSAADRSKYLVLNAYLQCVFGSAEFALKFKMKLSPAGRLVLVEHLTGSHNVGSAEDGIFP